MDPILGFALGLVVIIMLLVALKTPEKPINLDDCLVECSSSCDRTYCKKCGKELVVKMEKMGYCEKTGKIRLLKFKKCSNWLHNMPN